MARSALVDEALAVLRRWLDDNKIEPGGLLPSERSLAVDLKLGHYAVNRAMGHLVAEGAVKREGGKIFLAAAPSTPAAEAFNCELVVPLQADVVRSFRKAAKEARIGLQIHYYEHAYETISILQELALKKPNAVLFAAPFCEVSIWESCAEKLCARGVPLLVVGQCSSKVPSIIPDLGRALENVFAYFEELGHREIAFASPPPAASTSIEINKAWKQRCLDVGFHTSRERVYYHSNRSALREDAEELASKLSEEWKGVTALIVSAGLDPTYLVEELARRNLIVPNDIAVAYIGNMRKNVAANFPIAIAPFDNLAMLEMAYRILQGMAEKKGATANLKNWCVRFHSNLLMSGAGLQVNSAVNARSSKLDGLSVKTGVEKNGDKSLRELENALGQRYSITANAVASRFVPIDLTRYLNRPLNFRRGWFGDKPLKHFPPGERWLHGVPFNVAGGTKQSDYGVIVFRSSTNAVGRKRDLPDQLTIPIERTAQAVYILHGCGFAQRFQHFATYTFHAGTKEVGSVPLISQGRILENSTPPSSDLSKVQPNIQDWWAEYEHFDFPNARRVPIIDVGTPGGIRTPCLYTLEWVNPLPNKKLTHLVVSSVAEQSTTLGLLAITVLLT